MIDSTILVFFDEIAPILDGFAKRHNLLIEKYFHDIPSWRFSFRHPEGGLASVELIADTPEDISVYSYWWQDDFDNGTRLSRNARSGKIRSTEIENTLEDVLRSVTRWRVESLDELTDGFKDIWHRSFTKEEFLRTADKYPPLLF